MYANFNGTFINTNGLTYLEPTCQFSIGDNTGDPVLYYADSYISVRELRTWDEARTLGQLMYYSNRGMQKGT